MDKTKHPDIILILTYSVMSFCWAGKALYQFTDMIICGLAGLIFGVVIVTMNKTKLPTCVNRAIAAIPSSAFIFIVDRFVVKCVAGSLAVTLSMLLPALAGSMFVEGLCTSGSKDGKSKMITAVLISVFMAAAIVLTSKIMGVPYV